MASEQQRRDGGAPEASPPVAADRLVAGDSPPAGADRLGLGDSSPAVSGRSPSVDDRLLRATIDVVATVGYAATQAVDIVQAAGLSRTVFYRHFGGKRGATLAVARWVLGDLERVVDAVLTAPSGSGGGRATAERPEDLARVGSALAALATALAADPPAATLLFLEVPAVGVEAQAVRAGILALLARILDGPGAEVGIGSARARAEIGPGGCSSLVRAGALHHVLYERIARGETSALPAVVSDLVRTVDIWPPGL